MKKILFLTTFFLISIKSNSQTLFQDGTITLPTNEIKIGVVKILNSKSIVFKEKGQDSKIYTVSEIKSFIFDDKIYVNIDLPFSNDNIERVFVNLEFKGDISLFQVAGLKSSEGLFIQKKLETPIKLSDKNYIVELRKLLFDIDNEAFIQQINNKVSFSKSNIVEIITKYCLLKSPNSPVIQQKSKFSFGIGLIAGYSLNSYKSKSYLSNEPYTPFSKYSFSPVGIQFSINPQKSISAEIEVNYNQYKGERIIKYTSSAKTYKDIIEINERAISIPINVKYSLKKFDISPFFKLGVKYVIEPNFIATLQREVSTKGSLYDTKRFNAFGYNISMGLEKIISSNKITKLEYRFSHNILRTSVTRIGDMFYHQIFVGFTIFKRR